VVLVEAGQKGGGEGGKAVLCGVLRRSLQTVGVAVGTAAADVPRHSADELPQAVVLTHPHLHIDGGGICQQAVPPGLVLLPGVDVGIVPQGHRLDALGAQRVDTGEGAGGAAGVEQDGFHRHIPRFCSEWDKYIIRKKEGKALFEKKRNDVPTGKKSPDRSGAQGEFDTDFPGFLNSFFTLFTDFRDCKFCRKRVKYQRI
jgi:hypothetical protein